MKGARHSYKAVTAVALTLATFSLPAVGQDRLERRTKPLDITVDGVRLRVPGKYAHGPNIPVGALKFGFSFWVSDGEPVAGGVREIGATERVGRAIYWPSEPGRPFGSRDDFLVLILDVAFIADKKENNRQKRMRDGVMRDGGPTGVENGLDCHSYPTGYKYCVTPLGAEPEVGMDLTIMPSNPTWSMSVYSSADPMWVELRFPELGQSRWPEIVCRTLLLIRSWRISDGPPPPDCSKTPRLSSVAPRGF
jgi:hypothetical protein